MRKTWVSWTGLSFCLALPLCATEAKGKVAPRPETMRVAVFKGLGADPECLMDAFESLKIDKAIQPEILGADAIVRGDLNRFDALVLPGGGGMRQMGNLGHLGQQKLLDFVKGGKGVVGLCAGAYMLSNTPDYTCFHLGGFEAIDRDHDERGNGMVRFSFTPETTAIFPEFKGMKAAHMQYFEGPVLIPAKDGKGTSLATLESDVALKGDAPKNMTNGKAFLVCSEAGKGRVFMAVGHPENTPGMRWMLPRMVRWTLRKELVNYGSDVVRVTRNDREVLFSKELKKKERAYFDDLILGSSAQKRTAISELLAMRSWGAKERLEGVLRDEDPEIRLEAAKALVDLEHTAARLGVEAALTVEKDAKRKKDLEACVKALKAMTHGR